MYLLWSGDISETSVGDVCWIVRCLLDCEAKLSPPPSCSTPAVRWLAEKVLRLLSSGSLVKVMVAECREVSGARLTAQQEHLVGVLCRLPDVLSNRLSQHLDPGLLPQPYFSQLGADVFACLQQVHSILRGRSQNAHDV